MLDNHQLINQSSGVQEYYTPANIIEAARQVLGGYIELDPASCLEANRTVCAERYFTKEDDGLSKEWRARTVWMNHPFGKEEYPCGPNCKKKICPKRGYHQTVYQPGNGDWITKFVWSYQAGHFKAGLNITFASTSEDWFQPLLQFPACFLRGRTNYNTPGGGTTSQVPKGSAVFYLGSNVPLFYKVFSGLGNVVIPAVIIKPFDFDRLFGEWPK